MIKTTFETMKSVRDAFRQNGFKLHCKAPSVADILNTKCELWTPYEGGRKEWYNVPTNDEYQIYEYNMFNPSLIAGNKKKS